MILHLFRRRPSAAAISLYDQIVAQARSPGFYRYYGVSDTLDGRFEMLILHLFLLLHRLKPDGNNGSALAQQVFDRFCQDMDENLREIGVGDLKVPEEMRRIGEAFYGRAAAYEAVLRDTKKLQTALARNILGTSEPAAAMRLAGYAERVRQLLAAQDFADFERGLISFPEP